MMWKYLFRYSSTYDEHGVPVLVLPDDPGNSVPVFSDNPENSVPLLPDEELQGEEESAPSDWSDGAEEGQEEQEDSSEIASFMENFKINSCKEVFFFFLYMIEKTEGASLICGKEKINILD